jgi:hypothetical protein
MLIFFPETLFFTVHPSSADEQTESERVYLFLSVEVAKHSTEAGLNGIWFKRTG